tara:strand:- start:40 stop:567 length:528 start_codon:yes stop_codon:yes gene_type:complete
MILWSSNARIDDNVIDSMIVKLKNNLSCYNKEDDYYSSYYISSNERPEKDLIGFYDLIINQANKSLTLHGRLDFEQNFWMQLYRKNGGTIENHHHYHHSILFSWVHFIKPTNNKCFYFINHLNEKTYPEQQNEGDFILFPSYLLHGVDVNISENDRVVTSGNVISKNISQIYKIK